MGKNRKNKKMGQNKKNLSTNIIQTGLNYVKNNFTFWRRGFISKGYNRVEMNRKQGMIGK